MNIIVGHTNMDLDCFGSMVLARYLYPGYRLVRSRHIHPIARNLYNLYQNHLDMIPSSELKEARIENMVIVDTRTEEKIKEYIDFAGPAHGDIIVYDHHSLEEGNINGATVHNQSVGANTTLLGLLLQERGITISSDDATIALAGIYADTGNFTHENVTHADFSVAAYLTQNQASIKIVKKFLQPMKEEHQITLFHELLNRLYYAEISGHFIILSYLELEKQTGGLAAVVEKVFEVENADAIFSVFGFKKEGKAIIVGRSQKDNIDVGSILSSFGGGGHHHAASALIKKTEGTTVFSDLEQHLHESLLPAVKVKEIMTRKVGALHADWSLIQASMFLENIDHTGAPVIDGDRTMIGFMTLKDIMKGRKGGQMNAPVKAYMTRKVISVRENATIRDVEHLLYTNNIGHLPVVENGVVTGIVTRADYLEFIEKKQQSTRKLPLFSQAKSKVADKTKTSTG